MDQSSPEPKALPLHVRFPTLASCLDICYAATTTFESIENLGYRELGQGIRKPQPHLGDGYWARDAVRAFRLSAAA